MIQDKELTIVRSILTGSFFCSIVLASVLAVKPNGTSALREFNSLVTFTILLLGIICLWFLVAYLHRKKKPIEWFLSLAALNLLIVVPELAIRVTGFRYEAGIEFGYPRPYQFVNYEPDEKLFWKLKSSNQNVNSLGFPGEEIVAPKPKEVFRILFLGDSVTQQGYPDLVEHLLNTRYPHAPKKFECVTLAVAGYSSHQGRILAEMYGSTFEPDLVVVFFGWNDHWQAYGVIDSEKTVSVSKTGWAKISDFAYHQSRFLQFLNATWVSLAGSNIPIREVRVPPEQYRANLRRIKEIFDRQRVSVIFITAPTSFYRLGVPDRLVKRNFVLDKQSAVLLHKKYNQIVRDIAQTEGAFILDLELKASLASAEELETVFQEDGIHLTQTGLQVIGTSLADFVETNVLRSFSNFHEIH